MNQREQILDYIDRFGSITPMEAFADLGITKLATRVSEMPAKDGICLHREPVQALNRFGKPVTFFRYSMPKEVPAR